jgi:ABC-type multidrug transport system ATPase subunit
VTLHFDGVWGGGFALTHTWDAGLTCLTGGWEDGADRIFALASGSTLPEHGKVTLDGARLFDSPASRARVVRVDRDAWLPQAPSLLAALTQLQALHAPELQGEPPLACLERMGLGAWATRPPNTLSNAERRGALLGLALGFHAPRLLLLADPGETVAFDAQYVTARLAELARTAIVLFATERPQQATALGARTAVLSKGRLLEAGNGTALSSTAFGCLRLACADATRLATLLLALPEVHSAQAPLHSQTLEVTGSDPQALSLAIMRTALSAGIRVDQLVEVPPQLDVLQAALRGRADGAYAAAYQSAWQQQQLAGAPQLSVPHAMPQQAAAATGESPSYAGRIDGAGRTIEDPDPGTNS